MNPSLEGYAAAVLGGVRAGGSADASPAGEIDRVAADLRSVETLVNDNGELLSALTDTAVPAAARRGVLADLLAERVGPAARRAAVYAVGAVSAPEVPGALAWLANRAAQLADGDVRDESPLGHLAARRRVAGFAAAVFEDVPTRTLDDVEDELFRFARTVESVTALRAALSNRDLPVAVREAIAVELLGAKVTPATLSLVRYALVGGRSRDLVGTLDYLVVQTAAARGWRVARVRAAQDVDDQERADLSGALARLTGGQVELQITVDPALLSGVLVQVGDLQLDATVRGRLEVLREHMRVGSWDSTVPTGPDHLDGAAPGRGSTDANE